MTRFFLALARLCSSMWVGGALLFVATSVAEQINPEIDASMKGMLALIRFPWYYAAGATLLTVGFISAALAGRGRRPVLVATGLLASALALMAVDYLFVYREIVDVLAVPGDVPPGRQFASLHAWSERLNTITLLLSIAAAIVLCAASEEGNRK